VVWSANLSRSSLEFGKLGFETYKTKNLQIKDRSSHCEYSKVRRYLHRLQTK
jgi:hypothetical protein